jgi:drug/metabolite transporter, DME family
VSGQRRVGFLFVSLSAVVFGSLGVATKGVFTVATTNASSLTLLRAVIAGLACFLVCVFTLGARTFRIARGDARIMVLAGLVMAAYQVTFVLAITLANVTIAALVTLCTVPVIAAVLSRWMLRESLRPSTALALVCAIVGVALLVGFDGRVQGRRPWMGVGLALVSAVSYSLFQVCGRVVASRYHPMQTLAVFFLVAALALAPVALANGLVLTYPPVGWLLLAHLGLVVSVLGYVFLVLGLRTTPVATATIISLLEPFTSTLLAWLLLGERLGPLGILGGALLLSAMAIVFRTSTAAPVDLAAASRDPVA